MAGEEAVGEAHLIDDEEAEEQTDDAAGKTKAAIQTLKAWL